LLVVGEGEITLLVHLLLVVLVAVETVVLEHQILE
jgi:hypothetical protein